MLKAIRRILRNIRRLDDAYNILYTRLDPAVEAIQAEMDALRSRIDVSDDMVQDFHLARTTASYQRVYQKESPLVTVCIGTYNRGRLLIDRSLQSILRQDYTNLEIIVVGDCCTDNTAELMSKISDKRLRFVNLPERGNYPDDPQLRWMVAGTATVNHALSLANGDYITHLDDDDEYTSDRIGKLVKFIRETRADVVWHPFWREVNGTWTLLKSEQFKRGYVTTSCVLYHHWLKRVPWDMNAYKYLEPGDWNRFRKMKYLGVKGACYPEPLLKHFTERNQ